MCVIILTFTRNKPYSIVSYRTPNMDKTLWRGRAIHYRTDLHTIVFWQIWVYKLDMETIDFELLSQWAEANVGFVFRVAETIEFGESQCWDWFLEL